MRRLGWRRRQCFLWRAAACAGARGHPLMTHCPPAWHWTTDWTQSLQLWTGEPHKLATNWHAAVFAFAFAQFVSKTLEIGELALICALFNCITDTTLFAHGVWLEASVHC